MPAPTFLLIGAQKSGSTWLAAMLDAHPEICTPARKELHYFDRPDGDAQGIGWYESQFRVEVGQRAIGECTPDYLWSRGHRTQPDEPTAGAQELLDSIVPEPDMRPGTPDRIFEQYPDLKLLVVLRDPVQRAISGFKHHIRQGRLSPRARFRQSAGRYGIVEQGFYDAQLEAWTRRFDPDRFKILIFEEDVLRRPERSIGEVYEHLGVDHRFVPENLHDTFNEGVGGFYLHVNSYAGRVARPMFKAFPSLRRVNVPRPRVTVDDIADLCDLYREDTRRLAQRLDRPLDRWVTWPTESNGARSNH